MSQPDSELDKDDKPRGVLVRQPQTSVYNVLLIVASAALAVGCVLLLLGVWEYGAPWERPWSPPPGLR